MTIEPTGCEGHLPVSIGWLDTLVGLLDRGVAIHDGDHPKLRLQWVVCATATDRAARPLGTATVRDVARLLNSIL